MKKSKQKNLLKAPKKPLNLGTVDIPFLVLVIILLVFGLIMVASSSYVFALYKYGDSYYYIKRQLAFALGEAIACP